MTTTLDDRISQFEKMAREDPDNDMAHFSLGNAYLQAKRSAEAARSLQKCLELNPEMSKAYQLAGQAMIDTGWADQAVSVLTKGYEIAASKGDRMPMQAMADLLKSIGREPPKVREVQAASAPAGAADGTFVCKRTGRTGTQLAKPPFRGPLGKWIFENISAQTWQAWIGQGTKVINELRLDFSRDQDQETYDLHMREFLGIDTEMYAQITTNN
jgi:Fe-S cluster biosynthesis and repair protein YggX/thioredoxin-like negative regulator of GroEL